jgi:hypothetical protein
MDGRWPTIVDDLAGLKLPDPPQCDDADVTPPPAIGRSRVFVPAPTRHLLLLAALDADASLATIRTAAQAAAQGRANVDDLAQRATRHRDRRYHHRAEHPRGHADRAGAADRHAGRHRPDQQADRRAAVPVPPHRGRPPAPAVPKLGITSRAALRDALVALTPDDG